MRKLLVSLAFAALAATACATSVTSGTDDTPLNAAGADDAGEAGSSSSSTTPSGTGRDASTSNPQNDSGSTTQDSGIPVLDAMPDVGPPPPDAATGGGGLCDLNDPLYVAKAIIEVGKSSPNMCGTGCSASKCCFWVYQVCVDL